MKRFTSLLIIIMFASITITSCKKDSKDKSNEFKFDGSTMSLDKGFIEDYGDNGNGSYDFDVTLVSEGLSFDSQNEFSGSGDILYLDLNSPISTGLSEGTYVWSEERAAFTIVFGDAILNANVMLETGQEVELKNGSVDISFDDDKTILEFDMITEGDLPLTGYFKGKLQEI